MAKVIDVLKILEINKILKEKGMEYTLHSNGGCASCGVELRCYGKEVPVEVVCEVINQYLKDKWMQVEPIAKGSYYLKVV